MSLPTLKYPPVAAKVLVPLLYPCEVFAQGTWSQCAGDIWCQFSDPRDSRWAMHKRMYLKRLWDARHGDLADDEPVYVRYGKGAEWGCLVHPLEVVGVLDQHGTCSLWVCSCGDVHLYEGHPLPCGGRRVTLDRRWDDTLPHLDGGA